MCTIASSFHSRLASDTVSSTSNRSQPTRHWASFAGWCSMFFAMALLFTSFGIAGCSKGAASAEI